MLGFGCAALGSRTSSRVALNAVASAIDHGVTFFDTAPFYGQGESERIIGAAIGGRRNQIVVATKVGLYPSFALRAAARLKPMVRSVLKRLPGSRQKLLQRSVQGFMRSSNEVRLDRASIARSVEASLRRLRCSHIDLLLLHVTPGAQQLDEVLGEMRRLKDCGKIRHYGASSHDWNDMLLWLSEPCKGIAALQIMLNLCELAALDACLPLAAQLQVGIIAREPLARGRLIPPRTLPAGQLGFLGEEYDTRYAQLADSLHCTVPQLAIRFLTQAPEISTVLTGMSSPAHLKENIEAANMPPLSAQDMATLRMLAARNPRRAVGVN